MYASLISVSSHKFRAGYVQKSPKRGSVQCVHCVIRAWIFQQNEQTFHPNTACKLTARAGRSKVHWFCMGDVHYCMGELRRHWTAPPRRHRPERRTGPGRVVHRPEIRWRWVASRGFDNGPNAHTGALLYSPYDITIVVLL